MSYRFVRVTNNYPQFIEAFYKKHPDAAALPYKEQHALITKKSIESATSYTKNLNLIGVEAFNIITNATPLQNAWKKENNLSDGISMQETILKQLQFYKPDVLWIDDFSLVDKQWKNDLLKNVPTVKLLLSHHCAPYNDALIEKFRLFDCMFTCAPSVKIGYDKLGIKAQLMYHGFETSVLDHLQEDNLQKPSDFLFSGSLYTGVGFHSARIAFIETMLAAGINMDLYCNIETSKKTLVKAGMHNFIKTIKKVGLASLIEKNAFLRPFKNYDQTPIKLYSKKLKQSIKEPVFGYEMYQLLSKAKICLNIHATSTDPDAGNIRLFEATGVGSCLVTDWKNNINELFIDGQEIVTYKSAEECIEKVKWLLNNPAEREKIAKAGQARTLKDHTIAKRTIALNEFILKELAG